MKAETSSTFATEAADPLLHNAEPNTTPEQKSRFRPNTTPEQKSRFRPNTTPEQKSRFRYIIDLLLNSFFWRKTEQEAQNVLMNAKTHLALYKKSGFHYTIINLVAATLLFSFSSLCFGSWFEVFYNSFSHSNYPHLEIAVLALCGANIIHSAVGKLIDGCGINTATKHGDNILTKLLNNLSPKNVAKREETCESSKTTKCANYINPTLVDYFVDHSKLAYKFLYGASQGIIFLYYLIRLQIFFETTVLMGVMVGLNLLTIKWNEKIARVKKDQKSLEAQFREQIHTMIIDQETHDQQIEALNVQWQHSNQMKDIIIQIRQKLTTVEHVFAFIPTALKKITTPAFALLIIYSKELALPLSGLFTPGSMAQALFCADAMWRHIGGLLSEKSKEISLLQGYRNDATATLEQGGILDPEVTIAQHTISNISKARLIFRSLYISLSTLIIAPYAFELISLFVYTNTHAIAWVEPVFYTLIYTATAVLSYNSVHSIVENMLSRHQRSDSSHHDSHWDIHVLAGAVTLGIGCIIDFLIKTELAQFASSSLITITAGFLTPIVPLLHMGLYVALHLSIALYLRKYKYPTPQSLDNHNKDVESTYLEHTGTQPAVKHANIATSTFIQGPLSIVEQKSGLAALTVFPKKDVSIEFSPGVPALVAGRNGAGKSTIIKHIFQKLREERTSSQPSSTKYIRKGLENIILGEGTFLGVPQSAFTARPLFEKTLRDGVQSTLDTNEITRYIQMEGVGNISLFHGYSYLQFLLLRHLPPSKYEQIIENWATHEASLQDFLIHTAKLEEGKIQTCFNAQYSENMKMLSGGEMQKVNAAVFHEMIASGVIQTMILDEPLKDISKDVKPLIFKKFTTTAREKKCVLLVVSHETDGDFYTCFDRIYKYEVTKESAPNGLSKESTISRIDRLPPAQNKEKEPQPLFTVKDPKWCQNRCDSLGLDIPSHPLGFGRYVYWQAKITPPLSPPPSNPLEARFGESFFGEFEVRDSSTVHIKPH